MGVIQLLNDFHIPYKTTGEDWINLRCCYCPDHSEHMGINTKLNFVNCWRCGGHEMTKTISLMLGVTIDYARTLMASYGIYRDRPSRRASQNTTTPIRQVDLPPATHPIRDVPGACSYLTRRKFDIEHLESQWGIKATGPGAVIKVGSKTIDYSYRIIVPIMLEGKIVSYQARDWTGKNNAKYLACPKSLESVHHKDLLYGAGLSDSRSIVLVEGVADVWRFKAGDAVCTFGIKYRPKQAQLLAAFERVIVMFDSEKRADFEARKIVRVLSVRKVVVFQPRLPPGKDPADMSTEELYRIINKEVK